jgi:hypothetical protein
VPLWCFSAPLSFSLFYYNLPIRRDKKPPA